MAGYILCFCIFRIILPLILSACIVFRPCGLSAIYLIFLFILPIVPAPTFSTMAGYTGLYLKILMAVSILTAIGQFAFQIVLLAMPPYGHFLKDCENLEKILRHVGFVRLDSISVVSAITWISPEVLLLLFSIATFVICNKLLRSRSLEATEDASDLPKRANAGKRPFAFFVSIGRYAVLLALCLAGVLRPSVPGGFYFLVFLSTATWWACYKQLKKGFAIFMRCLMVIVLIHMSVLYAYQFEWPQELLAANSTYSRLFGLTPILSVDCDQDPRVFIWSHVEWATYVNPVALFLLYYVLALESKVLLKPESQKKQGPFSRLEGSITGNLGRQMSRRLSNRRLMRSATTKHRWQNATRKVRDTSKSSQRVGETTPLIRGVSPSSRRYGSGSRKAPPSILQDSTGSVIVTDDIPLDQLGMGTAEEDYKPTIFENVMYAMDSLLQVIIKSSYIGTNIIMMTWSITYLSWITFVLLLWANLLWLVPNQRKSMLRSSPFLVVYAWFLLISAYIYSMNLTEDELPSTIDGFNLTQIGFVKVSHLPCNPLLVKCLFTAMFWITLRQYMQERLTERQTSALADMVAPLQVTVGTATGVSNEQETGSKVMEKIGQLLKKFLTKFWIWIVAITLFVVAITGQRMTGFRILYMALFLFFILSFQLSYRVWRRVMFGFWLTVIVYSMIILVLVYTYQFNNFDYYWSKYLKISVERQKDIGLERFETKQLFIRLVTPTSFVIITVIQLHYFHKDFMEMSEPKTANTISVDMDESSLQGGVVAMPQGENDVTSSVRFDLTDVGNMTSVQLKIILERWLKRLHRAVNLVFLFLELHMPKAVMLFAMLLCVYDKCALYFVLIVLIVLAFTFGRPMLVFAIYCSSVYVSLMLLARMIYQIKYIKPEEWNVNCTIGNESQIENNAEWLGFHKTDDSTNLPSLVKWNIIYIVIVTLWSVILVRQYNYRESRGRPTTRAFFMFPKITRQDADKNLTTCIKYLFNYGFYRFGVEICLMAIVALIGLRMDMYAVMHSVWLCVLYNMNRSSLSKVWPFYMGFIAILLPIQYVMTIGLPPTLCELFPWDKGYWPAGYPFEVYRRFQEWAYLLDTEYPPSPKKLLCDFVLLLLVSREFVVFRIERRCAGQEYAGGSNESIIHHAEEKGFVNPVNDFITYVRTYLDIFKRGVLLSFLWITLAIVFLAGTNRVNIFSIGYLLGAFIFLWQGTDLYLAPIPKILKSWNWLLGYNIAVIFLKTSLQIVGCIFIAYIPSSSCLLIQLFGIGCVRKFGNVVEQVGIEDPKECKVPREFIGLVWDGLCFGFLIMQRRLFQSYNFFHMVNEAKAATILASRGAELIEELRQKRMTEQEEQERKVLEKIKAKMDKIKANQQKIQGASFRDSNNHYVEHPPLARSTSASSSCTSAGTSPGAGYHTPIDDDDEDLNGEQHDSVLPLTPRSSLIQPQAPPSPYSAVMTVSLEGYLEPQRMSFGSPPSSELNPRPPESPDDSFPVFSPPPYDDGTAPAPPYAEVDAANGQTSNAAGAQAGNGGRGPVQRQTSSTIGPPWMPPQSYITPRQSIISYSERSPLSHHEYTIFKGRPKYRRKPPKSYKAAIRSGDYYMFDDLDDEELDLIEEQPAGEDDTDEGRSREKPTVGELISSVMKGSYTSGLRKQQSETDHKRRLSVPLDRTRSIISTRSQLSAPLSAPPTTKEYSTKSVFIVDDKKEEEPQPGTSKDEEISELSEPKETTGQKISTYILFAWAFIESSMISATNFLNKFSKDYRYVIRVLTKEKKILKENTEYNVGLRLGSGQKWQPAGSYNSLLRQSREGSLLIPTPSAGTFSPTDSYRVAIMQGRRASMSSVKSEGKPPISEESDTKALATNLPYSPEQDRRKSSVHTVLPEIRIQAPSMERGLDSPDPSQSESGSQVDTVEDYDATTEMSSYDQPAIIRLLLALWFIVMSHSENLCYFVIFLNQIKSATFLSLPLPLMVFLWGTLTVPRPSKTFWVSIIAYTELIVLIKCMFQFDIIPWNTNSAVKNNPFYPPRIIGIERTDNYAVWDLLLLLVVFFHRFMLKSMGLWRISMVPAVLLTAGDYTIDAEDHMHPVESTTMKVKIKNSNKSINGSTSSRRSSDLQRLVEDTEDDDEGKLDQNKILNVNIEVVSPTDHFPQALQLATSKYAESMRHFFKQLLDPTSRVAADVYSYMFLCDFFNCFVILINYSSFGPQQSDEGVSAYLEENRVPALFLAMLILQFMLIIVDRGIFLRKNIVAKVVFQFIQVFMLHIWLFIMFPIITERYFNSVLAPQIYYMVKCFYLLLSAYQIRCGYPTRILGNFLCKGYNYVNMILFKCFMIIPFLFELRTVMDWMWTDTSMTMFDWVKMEDIFAHIFQLKCTRYCEDEYPQPRGERKKPVVKYAMGGAILALIIGIIWFPLVFFSLSNAVGKPNPPFDVTLQIRIGPYEPVYQMSAQSNSIFSFNEIDLERIMNVYDEEKSAVTFIYNYEAQDIAAVKLSSFSANIWSISPPDRQRMVEEVNSSKPLNVHLEYKVSHTTSKPEDSGVISNFIEIAIPAETDGVLNPTRQNLLKMLLGDLSTPPVTLSYLLPKFLKVTNRGTAKAVNQLMFPEPNELDRERRNLSLSLNRSTEIDNKEWWKIKEDCTDDNYKNFLVKLPYADCESIMLYTFNDKVFPSTLSFLTAGGIIGLYTTLVFVASRVLKGFFTDQFSKIMFDDMPNVDRVLQLCLDIYLVREAREYALEEDLFAKLVFLFRSPETLIKWTRPKEELDDDEDPEGEGQGGA